MGFITNEAKAVWEVRFRLAGHIPQPTLLTRSVWIAKGTHDYMVCDRCRREFCLRCDDRITHCPGGAAK